MSYSLRTWDAQGRLTLDAGMRTQRIIGQFDVSGGSPAGSFTDARMTEGSPAWIVLQDTDDLYDRAVVTFDAGTSTFHWLSPPIPFTVLYGTF